MISTERNDFRPSSPLSELDLQGFTDALDNGRGGGTRTLDHKVMSLVSYPLLHPTHYFQINLYAVFKIKHISKISVIQLTPRGGSYYVSLADARFELAPPCEESSL